MINPIKENRYLISRPDKNPFGVQHDPLEYYRTCNCSAIK